MKDNLFLGPIWVILQLGEESRELGNSIFSSKFLFGISERERVFDDKSYFIERYLYLSICGIFSIFLPQKLKYSQEAVPLYRGTPLGILWTRGPPCMRGYTAKRSFLQ